MIACLDTETTGLVPGTHQVIEIAAVLADPETLEELDVLEVGVLLRPGSQISAQAMAVNGIDLQGHEWRSKAVGASEAMERLNTLLRRASMVVGHNVAFDLKFLAAEAIAGRVPWMHPKSVCTKELASKHLAKAGKIPSARLVDVCSYYGISSDGAHRALVDVRRTLAVFGRLRELEPSLRPPPKKPPLPRELSVDEIHAQRIKEGDFSFPPSPPPPESDPGTRGRMEAARLATARWTREDWAMEELVAPASLPSTDPELKRARPSRDPVQLGLKTE